MDAITKAKEALREICDMQARHYGDGVTTHMELKRLAAEGREVLDAIESEHTALTDEEILSTMSRYWEHQWHDGDQYMVRISREQLVSGIRALLRHAVPVQAAMQENGKKTTELKKYLHSEACRSVGGGPSDDHCICGAENGNTGGAK